MDTIIDATLGRRQIVSALSGLLHLACIAVVQFVGGRGVLVSTGE
jgi:hypothetical protein